MRGTSTGAFATALLAFTAGLLDAASVLAQGNGTGSILSAGESSFNTSAFTFKLSTSNQVLTSLSSQDFEFLPRDYLDVRAGPGNYVSCHAL
jgi:hypothetical protein